MGHGSLEVLLLLPGSFLILLDKQTDCLHGGLTGQGSIVLLGIGQAKLFAFLVPADIQDAAGTGFLQCGADNIKRCGFHLAGEGAALLPALPLIFQHGADRQAVRLMLAVEGILALDGADMPAGAQVFGGLDKSAGNIVIGDGRELNGHILAGGALHTNGTVGDDKIAAQMDTLWDEIKRFEYPHTYYVDLSQKLWETKQRLMEEMNQQ